MGSFESKLGEIEVEKAETITPDEMDRLKASKRKYESELIKAGREAGKEWARRTAEFDQLHFLAAYRHKCEQHWEPEMFNLGQSAFGAGEIVHGAIFPDEGMDRQLSREFWSDTVGLGDHHDSLAYSSTYVYGFVEGAVAIYDAL